jgi:hypothetical protein
MFCIGQAVGFVASDWYHEGPYTKLTRGEVDELTDSWLKEFVGQPEMTDIEKYLVTKFMTNNNNNPTTKEKKKDDNH